MSSPYSPYSYTHLNREYYEPMHGSKVGPINQCLSDVLFTSFVFLCALEFAYFLFSRKWFKSDRSSCTCPKSNLDLRTRMQLYENRNKEFILDSSSYIVKLDGRNFTSLTSKFDKPYDPLLKEVFIQTAKDLLNEFSPSSVYSKSDEFYLVFNGDCFKPHMFSGNYNRLLSTIASYATSRFTHNLVSTLTSSSNKDKMQLLNSFNETGPLFSFSGTIVVFTDTEKCEILNYIMLQMSDCYNNYISNVCLTKYSQSQIDELSLSDRVKLLEDNNIEYAGPPSEYYASGVLLKKVLEAKTKFISINSEQSKGLEEEGVREEKEEVEYYRYTIKDTYYQLEYSESNLNYLMY